MMWWLLSCVGTPVPEPAPADPPPRPPAPVLAPLSEVIAHLDAGDRAAALALTEPRCAADPEGWACALAAHLREVEGHASRCSTGDAVACLRACEQLRTDATCAAATLAAEAACADGDARACTVRAEAAAVTGEPDDVVNDWLWVGCDTVDPLACLRLADRLERGLGARPAKARGGVAWLRNQGCDLQLDYACAPHSGWGASSGANTP